MKHTCWLLIIVILLTSGCYSVRKKFVRKQAPKEPEVYLNLKNYSKNIAADYDNNVMFFKGWCEEAIDGLYDGGNRKRVKRSLDEAISCMENIMGYYNEEGRNKILPLYQDLKAINDDFCQSSRASVVDFVRFKRRIEMVKAEFLLNFKYHEAKKWLKAALN